MPVRSQSRSTAAFPAVSLVIALALLAPAPAGAQLASPGTPSLPPSVAGATPGNIQPSLRPRQGLACRPGDTRAACTIARHAVRRGASPAARTIVVPPAPIVSDVQGNRLIPPKVQAFLKDPRVDPQTRTFLTYMSTKPLTDWTVQELSMVTHLVPTLTEMYIPTQTLSDFYAFLGLDPTQLFEPQLAQNWQNQSTSFDARNRDSTEQAFCLQSLGLGQNTDPTQITLGQVAACTAGGTTGAGAPPSAY